MRCFVLVVLIALTLSAARADEAQHVVLRPKERIGGPLQLGFIDVVGDRIVVGAWHSGGLPFVLLVDRATGETIADWRDVNPQRVRLFARTVVLPRRNGQSSALHDLQTGGELVTLQGAAVWGAPGNEVIYTSAEGRLLRRDPANGEVVWNVDLGEAFRPTVGALSVLREGAWLLSGDRREFLRVSARGKESGRLELSPAEAGAAKGGIAMTELTVGDDDAAVAILGGVPVDREGRRGAVYRLLMDGRPKDLALPGGRPHLVGIGRLDRDSHTWTFQRKGRWFTVLTSRADGSLEGEADTFHAVDVRRWRLVARSPRAGAAMLINDTGHAVAGASVWDVAAGEEVRTLPPGNARWLELIDHHALAWDPDARRLEIHPLGTGEARSAALPDAQSVHSDAPRVGDDIVLLTGDGSGGVKVIAVVASSGEVIELGALRSDSLASVSVRAEGRLWVVALGDRDLALHLFSAALGR